MTPNKYVGDVSLDISGKIYILRYDWSAIGKLRTELGADFDQEISRASMEMDMDIVATTLIIGLERNHPGEMTVEKIMKLSPPIIQVITVMNKAITLAFHGATEVSAQREKNPPMAVRILKNILIKFRKFKKSPTAMA